MGSGRRRLLGLAGSALIVLTACETATMPSPTPASPAVAPSPARPSDRPTPSQTPSPVTSPSPSPSPSPAVSPTPAPTVGPWQPIPDQDALASTQVQDVTWTGTRFVALGWDRFLDSPDGLSWHRQPRAGRSAQLQVVASGPKGVVAAGMLGDDRASWWSADGLTWTVRRDAFPIRAGRDNTVVVTDLVATDDGWLAVGREDPFCMFSCAADPVRALVWRSRDGLRWTRVPDQKSLRSGAMNAVTRAGSGLVAAGAIGGRAAFWTSRDGSTWSRVRDDPVFHPRPGKHARQQQTQASGVAAKDGVIVAVGVDYGAQDVGFGNGVRAWWSGDGRSWTEARVRLWRDGQVVGVTAMPTGYLAAGSTGGPPDGTSCIGGIWASADGRAWSCSALDPAFDGFGPSAAAASPTREITLGFADGGWDGDIDAEPWGAGWWRSVPQAPG